MRYEVNIRPWNPWGTLFWLLMIGGIVFLFLKH